VRAGGAPNTPRIAVAWGRSPSDCFARCGTQDNFYWWSAFETVRRLALTALVVVVKIVAPDFAVLYVMLVACTSLLVQAYFTPFKEDNDDILTIMFSMNEFLVATAMLCEQHWSGWSGSSTSSSAGVILSSLCSLSLGFALYRAEVLGGVLRVGRVAAAWGAGERAQCRPRAPIRARQPQPEAAPGARRAVDGAAAALHPVRWKICRI
jgi:hypothetical protein